MGNTGLREPFPPSIEVTYLSYAAFIGKKLFVEKLLGLPLIDVNTQTTISSTYIDDIHYLESSLSKGKKKGNTPREIAKKHLSDSPTKKQILSLLAKSQKNKK